MFYIQMVCLFHDSSKVIKIKKKSLGVGGENQMFIWESVKTCKPNNIFLHLCSGE